jgi:hypothetical protein
MEAARHPRKVRVAHIPTTRLGWDRAGDRMDRPPLRSVFDTAASASPLGGLGRVATFVKLVPQAEQLNAVELVASP